MADSKIDIFGLADKVLELRNPNGRNLSLEKTAEEINAQYLPIGAEAINAMTVQRWEKSNGITYNGNERVSSNGMPINAWAELVALKNRSEKNIQRLNKLIDELRGDQERLSEVASISNAYVSAMKQHQAITNDIAKYQREMLKLENVKRVVNMMMTILQKYPDVWQEFLTELKKHDEYEMMNAL